MFGSLFLAHQKSNLVWKQSSKDSHVLGLDFLVEKFGKPTESCQRVIITYSNILGIVIGIKCLLKRAWNEPGRPHQSSPRLVVDALLVYTCPLRVFLSPSIMELCRRRCLSLVSGTKANTADFLTLDFHDRQGSAMNVGPEFADKTQRFFLLLVRLRYNPPVNIALLRVRNMMRYNAQLPHTG